ncbi:MAG: hypothetical protein D6690_16980 [Nitrospirae bacterium]|nr:MAG: hypothetical protein D6690_16980 [Nitrospirota bacterium]
MPRRRRSLNPVAAFAVLLLVSGCLVLVMALAWASVEGKVPAKWRLALVTTTPTSVWYPQGAQWQTIPIGNGVRFYAPRGWRFRRLSACQNQVLSPDGQTTIHIEPYGACQTMYESNPGKCPGNTEIIAQRDNEVFLVRYPYPTGVPAIEYTTASIVTIEMAVGNSTELRCFTPSLVPLGKPARVVAEGSSLSLWFEQINHMVIRSWRGW